MDLNEKFLYHIWDAGHLQNKLETVSGKQVKIIYQGQFNTDRGPDFKNAIIEIDSIPHRGDVEIHLKTGDWAAHGHDEDCHYNALVLHVVLDHNLSIPFTVKENGETVEILSLTPHLSDDISKLLISHATEETHSLNLYCELLSAIDTDMLVSILNIYGQRRFQAKVRRFNALLNVTDFDQIIYEGMMEAIGYNKNKINLLQLAQNVSFAKISAWIRDGISLPALLSIVLKSGGLLDRCGGMLSEECVSELNRLYEEQAFSAVKLDLDWQLFRIRPNNHPLYRLIHLISFIYSRPSLLQDFLIRRDLLDSEPSTLRMKIKHELATVVPEVFGRVPGLGSGTIDTLTLNILIPIRYLYFQKTGDHQEVGKSLELYATFPGLAENYITRFMAEKLNSGQKKLVHSREIYQQGLIELYNRHCKFHLCGECMAAYQTLEH